MMVKLSALERQAEKDREARLRVKREDYLNSLPRTLKGNRDRLVRAFLVREVERRQPDRMSCCGAPKDGSEATARYARRHSYEQDGIPKQSCAPSRVCYQKARGRTNEVRVYPRQEEIGAPGRTECCGAPLAGDDPTLRYIRRHQEQHYGIDKQTCAPSRACRRLRIKLKQAGKL